MKNNIPHHKIMTDTTTVTCRRIGQGFCGTVWADDTGYGDAIKREDGGPGRSLRNDYIMHQRAFNALSTSQLSSVRIPHCHRFVSANDRRWWDAHIRKFLVQFRQPCNALVTDRIPPFSLSVREKLIDLYCPEKLRAASSGRSQTRTASFGRTWAEGGEWRNRVGSRPSVCGIIRYMLIRLMSWNWMRWCMRG